ADGVATASQPITLINDQKELPDLSLVPIAEKVTAEGSDFSARLEKQLAEAPVLGGIDQLELIKKPETAETELAAAEEEVVAVKPTVKLEKPVLPPRAKAPAKVARQPVSKRVSPAEPSWWGVFFSSLLSFVLGPLHNLFLKILEVYKHYRDQGKAPVFLMTTAGIVTLLFGLGYLLQYSFVYLLSPPVKMLLCVFTGIGFVGVGHFLSRSRSYLRDYASSLIALGFVIEFLVIYFASDFYRMIGVSSALIFYLINSVAAMAMAVKHETRVVAVVTLVGGLFVPGFGEHALVAPVTYCPYVLLICMGSLYLSRAIRWPELSVLTFISFSAASQLYVVSAPFLPVTGFAVYSCVAFLVFSAGALLHERKIKDALHYYDLMNLVANLSFFIWATYSVLAHTSLLNNLYTVFALAAVALTYLNRYNRQAAALLALYAAVLSGAAIAAWLGGEVWSLFFALEAVALLAVGCAYQNAWIRNEGYFALLVAVAQLLSLLWGAFGDFRFLLFSPAWVSLIACSLSWL
ncbi:MAG TPA: DUF2339 domain-containing protein, partial [Pseudomonadales bacterium]|nr:DUF2339 domain-containing protein [Pseudomonadales bacterium]